MKSKIISLFAASLFLSTVSIEAKAETVCGPRETIVKTLETEFEERLESVGITTGGGLIEIFTSATGTWTILSTDVHGMSCLVLTGDDWLRIASYKVKTSSL